MTDSLNSPFTILTCTVGIAGWIIAFIGLCTSHAFTVSLSWWIIIFELFVVCSSCAVFWTNSIRIYYPVILCLIAISIPYNTNEIATYLFAGRVSLSAAASGYIIMLVTQFSWIFLFGIQQEDAVLRSFSELNHSRMYTNNIRQYQKDTLMFDNNSIMDIKGTPNYPMPPQTSYSATPTPEHVAIPMYLNRSSLQDTQQPSTIILSPHLEYLIPVTAIHNYHANKEDPNELSFTKGEVLYVQEKKGSWWQAKKANGTIGMIPSNYVTDHKPI